MQTRKNYFNTYATFGKWVLSYYQSLVFKG